MFQAIVSVIAVKIQFNSPKGVFLSFNFPGMWSTNPTSTSPMLRGFCTMNQRKATRIGVVKHAVNKSAGNLALVGRSSFAAQGARTIQSLW